MTFSPPVNRWNLPDLGVGLGLRSQHIETILATQPDVGWFEVITENALHHRGWYRFALDQLRERYPILLHGVSLSIGGADPLDLDYLKQVKKLADHLNSPWISDHVCWTGVRGRNSHDLLPVAYDEATLSWMVERIRIVQDVLERPLMLENPSSYAAFTCTTMAETTFIARMAQEADCGLLLDVNNVYVSSVNHNFDPWAYLEQVPWDRVTQLHVAGHSDRGSHLFDSHIGPVIDPVWQLLEAALERTGGRATMLEWDDEIPDFDTVWLEAQKAAPLVAKARRRKAVATTTGAAVVTASTSSAESTGVRQPPPAVHELQTWFFDAITGVAPAQSDAITARIMPNQRMTAELRVAVYERMVSARLQEAMAQDFPAVQAELGIAQFEAEVAEFLRQHPSRHWALERLGAGFPAWLRAREVPTWLGACADAEWQLVTASWLPWQTPIAAESLANVAAERYADVQLATSPTTWLGRCPLPALDAIGAAWQSPVEGLDAWKSAAQHSEATSDSAESDAAVEPDVLVFRAGWTVDLRVVSTAEAALLAALTSGATLGEAVNNACADAPSAAAVVATHLGEWTQRWVADHVVTGLQLKPE